MIVHSNEKGLEKELDQLTSRLVIAMANRESLEEGMVIIISFTLYYISTCPNPHVKGRGGCRLCRLQTKAVRAWPSN